jgi:hypothetical protein
MAQQLVLKGEKWHREFAKAIELDGWGQVEEAREIYESLATTMSREQEAADAWTEKQQQAVKKLVICLRLRSQVIRRDQVDGINGENMKALCNVFENLFKKDKKFPIDLGDVPDEDLKRAMGIIEHDDDVEVEEVVEMVDKVSVAATPPRRRAADNDGSPRGGAGQSQFAGSPSGEFARCWYVHTPAVPALEN